VVVGEELAGEVKMLGAEEVFHDPHREATCQGICKYVYVPAELVTSNVGQLH
jgi:hypothetical protein